MSSLSPPSETRVVLGDLGTFSWCQRWGGLGDWLTCRCILILVHLWNPPILHAPISDPALSRGWTYGWQMTSCSRPLLTFHKGYVDFNPKERLRVGLFGYGWPWERQYTGGLFNWQADICQFHPRQAVSRLLIGLNIIQFPSFVWLTFRTHWHIG